MEILYERCCGIDVHKKMVMACIYVKRKKEIREFGTMTDELMELARWIREKDCQMVAMESTGVYWKPVYNLLEEEGIETIVVNAQHIKNVPGRKTDVKDAQWICDLTRHGLVRASFIPDRRQRELREMTRYRQDLIEERARELNRIQAVLEGANIKLGSVVSDINGKTGRKILTALSEGVYDRDALCNLAVGSLKNKRELLGRAVSGVMGDHQRRMLAHQLRHITFLDEEIARLDEDILEMTSFAHEQIALLDEIPGIGPQSAQRLIAEIGIRTEQFPSPKHFASWCGIVPGNNESAGKKKSTRIRKGNRFIKSTIVECARAAIRCKNSYFYAKYCKIAARRGGKRALIAVAHSMLLAIFHILSHNQHFVDLGSDYFDTVQAERIMNRNIKSLQKLGFDVSLSPAAPT